MTSVKFDTAKEWFEKLRADGRVYEDDGAWRFKFSRKPVTMQDLICGEVTIDYRDESNTPDMVIKRSDGSYVFHFVNVVDDLEMKISHVLRGEDHLMNTPKHLQLFEAFGVEPPLYGHIPLILNMDGSKMSKRDTGAAIAGYADDGYIPTAVFNFLSLLGWSPKDESEIMPIAEIIERCSYGADIFPGDVIGSGTVGTGCFLELNGTGKLNNPEYKEQWLQAGDIVAMEIAGLGHLSNTIVKEESDFSILALKKMP